MNLDVRADERRGTQRFERVQRELERQIALNRQKGEFVAAVSHELRTPLAGMLAAVETVLRLEQLDPAQRAQVLDRALVEGERLRRLVDDLLVVTAAEHAPLAVDLTTVTVGAVVRGAIGALTTHDAAELRIDLGPADDTEIETDVRKLERILFNLVENATKYASGSPIDITARTCGEVLHVVVADHGPGISPADRDVVFEPFVRLDGKKHGTGLGLYLCRELSRLLAGTLAITDTPGGGATFTLALPLRQPARTPHRSTEVRS